MNPWGKTERTNQNDSAMAVMLARAEALYAIEEMLAAAITKDISYKEHLLTGERDRATERQSAINTADWVLRHTEFTQLTWLFESDIVALLHKADRWYDNQVQLLRALSDPGPIAA